MDELNVKNPNKISDTNATDSKSTRLPTIVGEQKIFIAIPKKDKRILDLYSTFYGNLSTYLMKVSNSPAKNAVKKLIDRKLIYVGRNINASGKNGIIGRTVRFSNDRLAGIVVDIVELDIDPETGETLHIDQVFYASYYQFIRSAVLIHMKKVKDDLKLHSYLIKYLYYLTLKIIGSNTSLTNKQKLNLELLVSYFFYRHQLNFNHIQSKENAINSLSPENKKLLDNSIDILLNRLEKYEFMKDIFKGLVDFNIINETPATLIMKSLMQFKLTGFYSITTTVDYLIAACITSMYPVSFLHNTLVSRDLQVKVEEIITPLINSVKFDTESLLKL